MGLKITTEGDNGDIIFSMCIIKHISDGPHQFLIEPKSDFTASGKSSKAAVEMLGFVHDLVVSQPYISDCRMMEPGDAPFWRSGGFRGAGLHRRTETLMSAHLAHLNQVTGLGLKVDSSRSWLSVDGSTESEGRVVINRTARYRNNRFPWKAIVEHYGERLLFVGLPHEHAQFCQDFGPVEHARTFTLLEVARLIKGSALFIGNQSCAFACAEGMKHPSIQETSLSIPDCIFKRDNVQHVWDGCCTLPDVSGSGELRVVGRSLNTGLVSPMITPPGLWQFPGAAPIETFHQMHDLVSTFPSMRGKSRDEVAETIKQHNLDIRPDHYRPKQDGEMVRAAMLFAEQQSLIQTDV